MQVLEFVAVQVPLIIACAIFALAAILKDRKRKGSQFDSSWGNWNISDGNRCPRVLYVYLAQNFSQHEFSKPASCNVDLQRFNQSSLGGCPRSRRGGDFFEVSREREELGM